jgi:hypothetical protein
MIQFVKPSRGHITQRYANMQPDGNPHAGQDYAYTNGSEIFPEVYAAADGVVLFAGDSRGLTWPNIMYLNIDFDRSDNQDSSAGNYIIIRHFENGVPVALTGYGHLENYSVRAGQTVRAGQRIATVGATGFSFGKHLHFDLVLAPFDVDDARYYGRVDPNLYIGGLSYAGSITQSGSTTPKEWDEMASEDQIRKIVRAEVDASLVTMLDPAKDRRAGDGISWSVWKDRMLPGWNGDVSAEARIVGTDQAVNDIRAQLGAQNGMIAGLIGALAAINKGEPFDEAKLLAGVEAAAESGVKNAIESITVTIKEG